MAAMLDEEIEEGDQVSESSGSDEVDEADAVESDSDEVARDLSPNAGDFRPATGGAFDSRAWQAPRRSATTATAATATGIVSSDVDADEQHPDPDQLVRFLDIYFEPEHDSDDDKTEWTPKTGSSGVADTHAHMASRARHAKGTAVPAAQQFANARILSPMLLEHQQSLEQANIFRRFMLATLNQSSIVSYQQIPAVMLTCLLAFTSAADLSNEATCADLFEFFTNVRLLPSALSNVVEDFNIADQILLLRAIRAMISPGGALKIHVATDDSNRNLVDWRVMVMTCWNPNPTKALPTDTRFPGTSEVFFLAIRKLVGTTADDLSFLDWDTLTRFFNRDNMAASAMASSATLPSSSSSAATVAAAAATTAPSSSSSSSSAAAAASAIAETTTP